MMHLLPFLQKGKHEEVYVKKIKFDNSKKLIKAFPKIIKTLPCKSLNLNIFLVKILLVCFWLKYISVVNEYQAPFDIIKKRNPSQKVPFALGNPALVKDSLFRSFLYIEKWVEINNIFLVE